MEEIKIYRNSVNYIPIDVAKGIDRTTGMRVNADEIDPGYDRLPKCMHCVNFKLNTEKIGLGLCSAETPECLAYPVMVAVTCELYAGRK